MGLIYEVEKHINNNNDKTRYLVSNKVDGKASMPEVGF